MKINGQCRKLPIKSCQKDRSLCGFTVVLKRWLVVCARSTALLWINLLRNGRLNRYRYVHLMFNDKFNKPFVDFLNEHFNPEEHLVVCSRILRHPFPKGKNVMKVWTFRGLNLRAPNIKKIICHSLCDSELVDVLYEQKDLLPKAYWIIWGGDLYSATRDLKNDFVRSHFKGWVTVSNGDEYIAEKIYGRPRDVYNVRYIDPIALETVRSVGMLSKVEDGFLRVQINNSCDESTLEMLKVLAKYKNEHIYVRTILSYGEMQFRDEIIDCGRELFGDRFFAVSTYMSPNEYARYMATNDVVIFNQRRQQGLGNGNLAIAFGAKVYIRSEVSSFDHYSRLGIVVCDTNSIPDLSFKEFAYLPESARANNMAKGLAIFDRDVLAKLWRPVFAD